MTNNNKSFYVVSRWGIIFCVLSILQSFLCGAYIGFKEKTIKKTIMENTLSNIQVHGIASVDDKIAVEEIVKKSWGRIKRFHFHAGGIGTGVLILIILLGLLENRSNFLTKMFAVHAGIGSFIYPWGWAIAGWFTPLLGAEFALAKASIILSIGGIPVIIFTVFSTLKIFKILFFSLKKNS